MDSDIKKPKKDPLPSRSQELTSAREALVNMELYRYFQSFNREMELAFTGDQTTDELNHALDIITEIYSEKIVAQLFR